LPVSTVRYNVKSSTLKYRGGNGHPKKITVNIAKTIGQSICHDNTISLRSLATKLNNRDVDVSY
ncbi:1666_t:CDS:1, partial [Ambispora leptoticha]